MASPQNLYHALPRLSVDAGHLMHFMCRHCSALSVKVMRHAMPPVAFRFPSYNAPVLTVRICFSKLPRNYGNPFQPFYSRNRCRNGLSALLMQRVVDAAGKTPMIVSDLMS
ncbi:hypothetical protein K461DRAFT_105047 [Myriangium duriaei CBS 260.36]|uniref:Uncharacterized protein n=1 Tax=Myriangium duriaei CBS 260.36 TaxID=1168546 RepID=A0A9P4J3W9_9PEZI|nr:hypothetical protein K461DRAFT_105047 [Myriangium duriaei CBS 260.36]